MPLGSLDRAYRSEFHVPGRPHTYTQPTIYRWGDVSTGVWDGRRVFDKSDVFSNNTEGERPLIIKGGTHLKRIKIKVDLALHFFL